MENVHTLEKLKLAYKELLEHHQELEKCARDLEIANDNLDKGQIEKLNRKNEIDDDLSDIMFAVSHRLRKSVANILGISELVRTDKDLSSEELNEMLDIIIQSARALNVSTEELSKFIHLKKSVN